MIDLLYYYHNADDTRVLVCGGNKQLTKNATTRLCISV